MFPVQTMSTLARSITVRPYAVVPPESVSQDRCMRSPVTLTLIGGREVALAGLAKRGLTDRFVALECSVETPLNG